MLAHGAARTWQSSQDLGYGGFITIPGAVHAVAHVDLVIPHVNPFLVRLRP